VQPDRDGAAPWRLLKEFVMDRAYLLIAGVLTGAGIGLITGDFTSWLAAGAVLGVVMSTLAGRRPKHRANRIHQQPTANRQRQV
jgi:uncharacterized membrane protein